MIRARGLTRRFGVLPAVNRLDLEVERGEIFGLVGPDGAGKTTTLRLLCGLMDPSEGEAWVAGHDVVKEPKAVQDQIGYMAQRFGLYGDLTVDENMEFYSDLFSISPADRAELLPRLLRMTRMDRFRSRRAGQLSGGMKQKLALMCTLLHRPKVLFLDEPTTGVDPVSRRDFWTILYELVKDGMTVFITTAYLDEAERCNRVGLLDRGRLVRLDSPEALRTKLDEECYEVEVAGRVPGVLTRLQAADGVASVEPAGASLHLFLEPALTSPEKLTAGLAGHDVAFRRITPSLEDVFILLVRKSERDKTYAG